MKTLFTKESRKEALKKELERILSLLIENYAPEKVILFGSFVNDDLHEWSDLDLLIIKKTSKRPIDRCIELASLLRPSVGIDFFVYTPEEYEALLKEDFSFIREVEKKGRVLYEKRD